MLGESHGRALVIDRCWSIYLLLTEAVAVPPSFHVEFPTLVERALLSELLQISVHLTDHHVLTLREEYQLTEHHLEISHYSYVVTGPAGIPLLRADPLPHHRTDYRQCPLTAFPHHLHEGEDRILSFSGDLSDFMAHVKQRITRTD